MGSSYNDGRYPDGSLVDVRYPAAPCDVVPRSAWPWRPGSVAGQCGPDEWHVIVEARSLAELEDGTPAPEGTADGDLYFPGCYRDSSEIRKRAGDDG